MKKRYILISAVLLLILTTNSQACEICGCGNSNFQIGLLPAFNKGFLGYRYSASRFSSSVRDEPTEFSRDYYQTMELWGGYNLKKLQFMAFVPYVFSKKVSDDGVTRTNGLGDMMFLVNYKVFSKTLMSKNENTTIRHELYFGGGIKLPTGVNKVDPLDTDFNIGDFNSQAGTGSLDYIMNATYNFLWNNSGIVTNIAYRINTANSEQYGFGDRTYINTVYFYSFAKSSTKVKPNVGLNYQRNAVNKFQGVDVEGSNGYTLNATVGMNIIRNKIGFNAMSFIPVSQNTYDGQTKLKSRFLVGVSFSI